jgi:hypothetical protein
MNDGRRRKAVGRPDLLLSSKTNVEVRILFFKVMGL